MTTQVRTPPAQTRRLHTWSADLTCECGGCAGRAQWWASLSPGDEAAEPVMVGAVTIAFRAKSSFLYSAAQSMVPTDVTVQLSSDGGETYNDVATGRYVGHLLCGPSWCVQR